MATIIDSFPHIMPRVVLDRFCKEAEGWTKYYLDGFCSNPAITAQWDLDERFRQMDEAGDYAQIFTLNMPPIEVVARGRPATQIALAQLANDEMASLVAKYPDRFKGFAAALPMEDVDAATSELERSMLQLGAQGIQIFTNVNGRAVDDTSYGQLFARAEELNALIWVHGARSPDFPEYLEEPHSRFGLWISIGWPYEMGVFAARTVLSGLLDRRPNLRFYLHHSGGMVPTFSHRIGGGGFMYSPPGDMNDEYSVAGLTRPSIDYFRQFYADTSGQSPIAIEAALKFFGADRVLLGSDSPFRPPAWHLRIIESLSIDNETRDMIMFRNAERVFNL